MKRKIAKIADRVIAQLAEILCLRERERFKQQAEDGLRQAETHLTENEITNGATELLKSPDMLYRVKGIYDRGVMVDRYRFVLKEEDKKLLTFLIFLSDITSWSQTLCVASARASWNFTPSYGSGVYEGMKYHLSID
jgi:hypothetical protein